MELFEEGNLVAWKALDDETDTDLEELMTVMFIRMVCGDGPFMVTSVRDISNTRHPQYLTLIDKQSNPVEAYGGYYLSGYWFTKVEAHSPLFMN